MTNWIKWVNGVAMPWTLEEIEVRQAEEAAFEATRARRQIIDQISALEATMTPRRLREAARGQSGKAWLDNLDDQIAALRAQL